MQMPNITISASSTALKQFLRLEPSFWLNVATLIPLVLHKGAIWTGRMQIFFFWGRRTKISNAGIDHNLLSSTEMNHNG